MSLRGLATTPSMRAVRGEFEFADAVRLDGELRGADAA